MIVELAPFFDLGIDAIIEVREACYWYNTSNYQSGHIWIPQHVMVIKSEVCGHQIVFGVIDLKSEWMHETDQTSTSLLSTEKLTFSRKNFWKVFNWKYKIELLPTEN